MTSERLVEKSQKKEGDDIGDGFGYSDKNFDPSRIRMSLGLDGGVAETIPLFEKTRRANILFRTGNLSINDISQIGAWRVPNPEYREEGGAIFYDPPPGARNKHLRR